MSGALLTVSSLSVRYGAREALRGVSLQVRPGELVALVGPNGSGKSTLFRTVVGLEKASEGELRLGAQSVASLTLAQRARAVSWMPQEEPEGDDILVEEYVRFGRDPYLGGILAFPDPDPGAVGRAMQATATEEFSHRRVRALSGGERQRVRLARIFAQEAPLLLLDEPISHLDMGHQLDVLARIHQLSQSPGRGAVVAMHDLNLAARFADRLVVLSRGHLVAEGSPETVLSAELLARVWGVQAELRRDPRDHVPYLIPKLLEPERTSSAPAGRRVHVVAGGGSGGELLPRLVDAGYRVTAGALPLFDSDSELAEELRIPCVLELPFAPLSESTRGRLREFLSASELVVVAAFPVGPSNLGNLEELAVLAKERRILLLSQAPSRSWDFTGGRATELRRQILSQGGVEVASLEGLLERLPPSLGNELPTASPTPGSH